VALDHLVQRGRLDVQQLGRALLDAACGLERRRNQSLLEIRDHVLERNPLRRHDKLRRHLGARRFPYVVGNETNVDL
jgi:hypothetical protein